MSAETYQFWGPIIASAILAGLAYLQARKATRENTRLGSRKLDGEEFNAYREAMQGLVDNLQEEVDRLKRQLGELHDVVQRKESENASLKELARNMTGTINELHHQIRVLKMRLGEAT